MPTEKELIERGWSGRIVGALLITGTAKEGDSNSRWNAIGRWTKDIGEWTCANTFHDQLSFALDSPITFDSRPCGPHVTNSSGTTDVLKQKCSSFWKSRSSALHQLGEGLNAASSKANGKRNVTFGSPLELDSSKADGKRTIGSKASSKAEVCIQS